MANAILMNGKAMEEIEIENSIIKEYMSQADVISAGNFVDFVNETYFNAGAKVAKMTTGTNNGELPAEYHDEAGNINWQTPTLAYYYNQHPTYVYQLSDTLVLMFYCRPNGNTTTYGSALLFEISNNTVKSLQNHRIAGRGNNLQVLQLTDTMFITLAGSYKTATSTTYAMQVQAYMVDKTAKTLTRGTAVNIDSSFYYYYMAPAGLYKVSDTSFICFYADGNNNSYSYPTCKVCTVTAAGAITVGTRYMYSGYNAYQSNLMYRTFQMSPTKYVEVTYYNYPLVQIVTVSGTTCSRSGYVAFTGTAYTDYTYVYGKPFMRGNFVYIPYYNGSTWTIGSVNCSGTTPTLGTYQALAVAGTAQPVITKVSDDEVISVQSQGNVAYASYFRLNDQGGYETSHLVLTVSEKVGALRSFTQIGPDYGLVLCQTYGQTQGVVAIPVCWRDATLTAGKPQYWNGNYNNSTSYTWLRRVNDHYAIYIYAPFSAAANYNSINCFSIYQDGTNLNRSDDYTINKIDTMYNQNQQSLIGIHTDEENQRVVILYRQMTAASASTWDLYIASIELKGGKCFISPITMLMHDTDSSAKTYVYGNLMHIKDDQYVAFYYEAAANLGAVPVKIVNQLKAIPSELTGHISGVTLDQCTPNDAGRILVLGE